MNFLNLTISNYWIILIFALISISSGSNELRKGMFNGKEITALAYQFPPLFSYKKMKDGNYTFDGIFKTMLDDFQEYFNMSIKYIILDPIKVTKYGFWESLLETLLDNQDVDIIPFTMAQDFNAAMYMEISAVIWIDSLKLLQSWPEEQSRLGVTLRPFQSMVWFLYFITTMIFVFITAAFIINRQEIDNVSHRESTVDTIVNQVEYVFRIMTNQGNSGSHTRDCSSFKILTGIWLLSMVVLINGYSGVLTSYLTIPKLNPIANTLQEVAESNALRVTVTKNGTISQVFLDATEGYKKVIGDQLRRDPGLLVSDAFDAYQNVVHHKGAYLGVVSIVNYLIRMDFKTNGYCRVTSSPEIRDYASFAMQWGYPKGSPYAAAISEMILRLWANGRIAYDRKSYFHGTSQCRTDVPPKTRIGYLTLVDLSPAFFILGLGVTISALCFLLEITANFLLKH